MSNETREILAALAKQLDRLAPEPMSPVEAQLWNALSVLVKTLHHESSAP